MKSFALAALLALGLATSASAQYYPQYQASPSSTVRNWYQRYLGRAVDPDGLATWTAAMRNGTTPRWTLASILASDEYWHRSGDSPEGFVVALYRDVTGRTPAFNEIDYWMQRMDFEHRTEAAYDFLSQNPEAAVSSQRGVPAYRQPPPPPDRYRDRPLPIYRR